MLAGSLNEVHCQGLSLNHRMAGVAKDSEQCLIHPAPAQAGPHRGVSRYLLNVFKDGTLHNLSE